MVVRLRSRTSGKETVGSGREDRASLNYYWLDLRKGKENSKIQEGQAKGLNQYV